jgi:hypothetical protein
MLVPMLEVTLVAMLEVTLVPMLEVTLVPMLEVTLVAMLEVTLVPMLVQEAARPELDLPEVELVPHVEQEEVEVARSTASSLPRPSRLSKRSPAPLARPSSSTSWLTRMSART